MGWCSGASPRRSPTSCAAAPQRHRVRVHRGSRAGCNEGVDSQAFRELAIAEMDSLYRMAMHLTRHPEEAQDLVQETYLRALKKGAKFELREPRDPPVAAQNTAQQFLQPDQQTDARTDDLRYEPAASELERPAPAWDLNHLDWEQVDDRLKHAIEDLLRPLPRGPAAVGSGTTEVSPT